MSGPTRVGPRVSFVLAPNPGPMTLDGTNSYVLDAGDGSVVIVDPGPDDAEHVRALAESGRVELVLITHRHHDHTEASAALHRATGAPVRAPRAEDCFEGAPLADGERITVGDLEIQVIATPGHSADSVCFQIVSDGDHGDVLTGDTVLGRGSTVIGVPDGTLAQYLSSLRRLAALGPCRGLPAHGPILDDLQAACWQYLAHREQRLRQLEDALATLGLSADAASVSEVTDAVYGNVDARIRFAAEHSVAAQLEYLRAAGRSPAGEPGAGARGQ